MGRSKEEKMFHNVKAGKLHRVRSLLKKHQRLQLTDIVDRNGRTPLHICCLLGDDAIVRILLKHGADPGAVDSDGNTCIHFALKYALQTTQFCAYTDMIVPLLEVGRHVLDIKNNENVTPRECLSELKRVYAQRKEEIEDLRHRELRKESEHMKKKDEREWEGKLQFEANQENYSCLYSDDDSDRETEQESYDEWANRILHKRKQRNAVHSGKKLRADKEQQQQQQEEKARERTKQLEKEHEAYVKRISMKRQEIKLTRLLAEYESRCQVVFDTKSLTKLGFTEIPWPCQTSTEEMIQVIVKWSEMRTGEESKKFVREQQVRWHPDRFLQKCGDRLTSEERDKIVEQVKKLSQRINALLDETK